MNDTKYYTLSQDYELMLVLLDEGSLMGFVDYEISQGKCLRDPVRIRRDHYGYNAGVRGISYCGSWGTDSRKEFLDQCRKYHLSFIVPNAEISK